MIAVLPLIFALLIAQMAVINPVVIINPSPWPATSFAGVVVGLGLLLWWPVQILAGRLLRHRERLWDHLGTGLALLLHAGWCLLLAWPPWPQLSLHGILPFIALLVIQWRTMDRQRQARTGSNAALRLRLGILPLVVVLALIDGTLLAIDLLLAPILSPTLLDISALAALVAVLVASPRLILALWGTRPLPPGPLNDDLRQLCASARIRIAGLRLWPMPGRFHNAAVIGLIPRWRYLLFSPDLIRDLSAAELRAVVGHELSHARRGHLPLYLLFLVTGSLMVFHLSFGLMRWSAPLWDLPLAAQLFDLSIMMGLYLVLLRWAFGILSRACERQADLDGALLAGDPRIMQSALARIALLAGQDPATSNWRHYSIAERIAFLDRILLDPQRIVWHHRRVMQIRLLIIIALFVLLLPLLHRPPADLDAWRASNSRLDMALTAADDHGDMRRLRLWLNSAGRDEAGQYARLLLGTAQDTAPDTLYGQRHRIIPLLDVNTGSSDINREISNLIAYILVAGTKQPPAEDVELAASLLPRLREPASQARHWHIADTVGCVQMRLEQYEAAAESFTQALAGLDSVLDGRLQAEQRERLDQTRHLITQRLEAARNGDPLPLDPEVSDDPVSDE